MTGNGLASTLIKLAMASSLPVASISVVHHPSPPELQRAQADRPSVVEVEDPSSQYPISNDGYYYAAAVINGHATRMLIDSGANITVLSASDAQAVGIKLPKVAYSERLKTANGVTRIAIIRIKRLTIAHKDFANIHVAVTRNDATPTLIGNDVLSCFSRMAIADDVMQLTA